MCGIWGTLAVGFFGSKAGLEQIKIQLIGIAVIGVFCVVCAFIILFSIKKTLGLRVSEKEEIEGLDMHEHGMSAYAGFGSNDD
jgi:Amt family ammonium transporter